MALQEENHKTSSATLVSEVAASVEIEEIRFDSFAAKFDRSAGQGPLAVQLSFRASACAEGPKDPKIVVHADFLMQASPGVVQTDKPCCEISARITLTYASPKACEFTEEHLNAFARTNGIFNAWPYWRELVQSCTVRMGLPAFTVPSLKTGTPARHQPGNCEQTPQKP